MMRTIVPILMLGLGLAGPAFAQVERLPSMSRSERQSQEINRSLLLQNRQLNHDQQTQSEINSIRRQIQRDYNTPPLPQPSVPCGPGCR